MLNFPIKFHTIDHDSYSNSKNKTIINKKLKKKSPNLTQFNTKINKKINQYNINTIKDNGYSLKKYLEILPITQHYIETKNSNDLYIRLLNKQSNNKKNNNIFNYFPKNKQYLFNKSVDNKPSKEKTNGVNNYINYNNNKYNKVNQIRKKMGEPIEIKKKHKTIEEHNSNTPIKTEFERNNYIKTKKEYSFINIDNNINLDYKNDKAIVRLSKKMISKDRSKNKSNNKSLNINKNYYINKKNSKNRKNLGLSFNNNNNYIKEKNSFGIVNKRNNFLFEEKENNNKILLSLSQQKDKIKDKKKIKNKKASSLSIDLTFRNQGKNDINIYTNKPKRKNVMKFINKNNNNDINANFRINNIYNKYGYCYKNEIKKNIYNKCLDSNIKNLNIN